MHHKALKTQLWAWGGVCVAKISIMQLLGPFPRAKTTYKLLRNSKNVTNIATALNVRKHKIKKYLDLIEKFD